MAKQRQSTAGNTTKKTIRVPFAGNAQQRDTSTDADQRFINYVFETTKNIVTDTKKLFCVKRPGTVLHSTPSASAAVGRGMWSFNGNVWSVFGSKLYMGTTLKKTLSTDTGMCGACEFINADDYGNKGLFLADGIDAWIVDSSNTVTRVDNKHLKWAANTIIEVGDRRVPVTFGDKWYVCTVAGTTGTSEPTWPTTTVGETVTDGTVTWRYEGAYNGPPPWAASTAYILGAKRIPTTESGYWYEAIVAGTSGGIEPAEWPLIIGDIVTDGTVTWECKGQYGGFPTPHIPQPVFMDGYIFLAEQDSIDLYGSDIQTPLSWGALNFASAENYADPIIGVARQNNFIVAFGDHSTEFFYNAAKANQLVDFDTPLDRYESLGLQMGTLNRNAILGAERMMVFVGESQIGGHSVWRLDGENAKEISTEYVEKFIDLENSSTALNGYGVRIMGHMLFILNLPTANKTFVYDLEENMWTEWQYDGGMLPFNNFCDHSGLLLLQHATDGKIYKLDSTVYKDFNKDIECRVRLSKMDFDTDAFKFYHQTTIIGDKCTGTDILRWSDDDYVTWSNDKILTAGIRPYFMRSGHARRRAWEVEYTHNSPRRLEALEITYSIGDH